MNSKRVWAVPFIGAVMILIGAGLSASNVMADRAMTVDAPPYEAVHAAEQLSRGFEYVAETIAPSVVRIRSTIDAPQPAPLLPRPFFFHGPLDQFFDDDAGPSTPMPRTERRVRGEGSGVIVSDDGYILTNSHVVEDAREVMVTLADDRVFAAEIVGTDARTDVAVIKIEADDLTPARLGTSSDLRVGQWVVAAGSPFGLSSSITTGIVSATGRTGVGITDYEDFIQTDAAINRGNSGGPLANLRGEVVGINTAILSRSGGNIGIGFAIPIDMAKDVMDELIEDGRIVRGYLGVMIQDLSEGMAGSFDYPSTDGALVNEILSDGPAADAGLEVGDIIVRFDGTPVTNTAQLRLRVASVDPGTDVDVEVFRHGATEILEVRIDELPSVVATVPLTEGSDVNLGMTVETMTPTVAQRSGVAADLSGVVVTGVEPFGPAARAGLRPGDVITHVQGTAVNGARAFRQALRDRDLNDGVRVTVQRDSTRRFAFLQLCG